MAVLHQVCVGEAYFFNAVRGLFAHLPLYVFIFRQAVFMFRVLYGYCLQLYIFGIHFAQVTGTVFIGVSWGIVFGPLGLNTFPRLAGGEPRPFSSPV